MANNYKMLRIYCSNTDRTHSHANYQLITLKAKEFGMMGATVYKGIMGYGTSSHLTIDTFWELSEKIPVIIEIIDTADKVTAFAHEISQLMENTDKGCLIIAQDVDILLRKKGTK